MRKVNVLFFAADPLSAPPDGRVARLMLDEDVRQIREKVRGAKHRDALDFDVRWAVRTDDLLQALNETHPQVVHFSGHGGSEGLVLVDATGSGAHSVDAAALSRLFSIFRDDVRVVVLSACFSLPQAEAIAGAVGCAIGTRGAISDRAAITFTASFYRAIAFGHTVQVAYDQASAALALEHFESRECPELVVRPGVDPRQLLLVRSAPSTPAREGRRIGATIAGVGLASAVALTALSLASRGRETATETTAGPPAADSVIDSTTFLPVPDSGARVSRESAPGQRDRGTHPAAAKAADDGGEPPSVAVTQEPTAPSTFRERPAAPDTTFALPERPRERTIEPEFPG